MPKISNEERDRRFEAQHQDILQAAWRCFARNTTGATTMEEVAREAQCTVAVLYLHFQTKDELVRSVMLASVDGFEALVRSIGQSEAGATREGFVTGTLESAHDFGVRGDGINLFRLGVQSWGYAQSDVGLAEIISARYKGFIGIFTQLGRKRWGLNAKDARDHAVLIETLLVGYIAMVALQTDVTADEHIRAYRQLSATVVPRDS